MKLRARSKRLSFALALLNNDVNILRRLLHICPAQNTLQFSSYLTLLLPLASCILYLNSLATGLQSAQNNLLNGNKQYIRKVSDGNLGQETHTRG